MILVTYQYYGPYVTLTQYEATTPGLTSVYLGPCARLSVVINLDHRDFK